MSGLSATTPLSVGQRVGLRASCTMGFAFETLRCCRVALQAQTSSSGMLSIHTRDKPWHTEPTMSCPKFPTAGGHVEPPAAQGGYRDPHQDPDEGKLEACQDLWDFSTNVCDVHHSMRDRVTQSMEDTKKYTQRYATLAGLTRMPGRGYTDSMQKYLDDAEHARDANAKQHDRMKQIWGERASSLGSRPCKTNPPGNIDKMKKHLLGQAHWWRDEWHRTDPIMHGKLKRSRADFDMLVGHLGPPMMPASESPMFCHCLRPDREHDDATAESLKPGDVGKIVQDDKDHKPFKVLLGKMPGDASPRICVVRHSFLTRHAGGGVSGGFAPPCYSTTTPLCAGQRVGLRASCTAGAHFEACVAVELRYTEVFETSDSRRTRRAHGRLQGARRRSCRATQAW